MNIQKKRDFLINFAYWSVIAAGIYLASEYLVPIIVPFLLGALMAWPVVVLTRNRGYRKSDKEVMVPRFIYKEYPRLRVALRNRNKIYNEQLEMVERLEDEGKIKVIRPLKPIVVDRMETSVRKLTDLYEEGYACAKRMFEGID